MTAVDYYLFGSENEARSAFRAARESVNITTRGPACFEGKAREYAPYLKFDRDRAYLDRAQTDGEVACYRRQGRPHVVWFDADNEVVARAYRDQGATSEMMDWWIRGNAGPL